MSSLALKPEVSVSIPKLLLAAVQPYQTIAGPALSTNFLTHTSLLPFQKLSFTHSSVAPVYFHTLLHSLAEYCETPQPVRSSHVKQLHPPHENFWDDVGTLNCFYSTTYRPRNREHPAMGAVELVHASHRRECDVRLTLYDQTYQPLVAMLMTGPRGNKTLPVLPIDGSPTAPEGGSNSLRCRMLPRMLPPSEREGYWRSNIQWCGIEDVSMGESGNASSFGGLYGPLELLQGGGYAQRVCYRLSIKESPSAEASHDETQSVVGMPSEKANQTVSKKEDDAAGSAAVPHHPPQLASVQQEPRQQLVEAPPWMLTATVRDLCERLHREGCLSPAEGGMPNLAEGTAWCMTAYQGVQCGDVVFNESFDIVCAAPRVQPTYRVAPWRHQIGQPVAKGYGPCVVSLRVEIRQFSEVILCGTFYFQPDLPE
ncbi:unnamed protein product [Phytomonas sp. EM1]|nr:unnamed protein product [Phytomonas sp. EM1]|eukprot:CCW60261.1 unnamed protein product [Phytomonas sp. isolate EM1]